MTKESTNGPLSMKSLEAAGRADADVIREQAEMRALKLPDGRSRRKIGRTAPVSIRTFPAIKKAIHDMAEAQGKDYVEIVEQAVELLHKTLKGEK